MTARIVVGVDGSAHAQRALAWAVEEARYRDARIDAVLAWRSPVYYPGIEFGVLLAPTWEEVEAEARKTLRRALDQLPADVEVEPIVVAWPAARALLEAAKGADLLVVGSRGRGGFTGLLLGSTSHQVVSHAPCPVVVVAGPAAGEPGSEESG